MPAAFSQCSLDSHPVLLLRPSPSGHDTVRTLRSFAWNALVYTPVAHGWYCHVLPRVASRALARLPAAARGDASLPAAAVKVAADQTLFGPLVIGGFMTYSALVQGRGTAGAAEALNKNYWDVLVANWMVWPALQLVNFKFVPLQLQILVMNTAVVGWSTYLALRAAGNNAPESAVVPEVAGDIKKASIAK